MKRSEKVENLGNSLSKKRVWERIARLVTAEEFVFGSREDASGWSRDRDFVNFTELMKFLEIEPSSGALLDVGCGPLARAEVQLGIRGCRIVGLDISPTVLKMARENVQKHRVASGVDLVLGDAEFLPFKEVSFEVAISMGLIPCLTDAGSARRAIDEMKRVIKLNGTIYVSGLGNLFSLPELEEAILRMVKKLLRIGFGVCYLNFKGFDRIVDLFHSVELEIVEARYGPLLFNFTLLRLFGPRSLWRLVDRVQALVNKWHGHHSMLVRFSSLFEVKAVRSLPTEIPERLALRTYRSPF